MDRTARVIGVPMDLGADRRGVDMGPSAIRYAGLAGQLADVGYTVRDSGDIAVPRPEVVDPDADVVSGGPAKYLAETESVARRLADEVAGAVDAGDFPLVLGGDHSIAIGTARGLASDREVGILWFDAHGDYNTPTTTPSGNVHGMALAAILSEGPCADWEWARSGIASANVAWIGLRDVDDGERDLIQSSEATAYPMSALDRRGVTAVVTEALDVVTDGVDALYVSLDMDWLDPTEAPGVGTPVRGGVSYREAHSTMELIADHANETLAAIEVVEVNPILDQHNRTAELACELVASALGKRIL